MFAEYLEQLRQKKPLIHNITNYVTANDCANLLLACGASPIMADDPAEAAEITALSQGLTINMGTLHQGTIPAMLFAGKKANELGHPVVLDPVGAGASSLRTQTAIRLLQEIRISIVRGNLSEIKTLALGSGTSNGVDACAADQITEESLDVLVPFLQSFAARIGAVVAVTGAIDIVADARHAFCIRNGHPMMRLVTGAGCQLSCLVTAFAAANPEHLLEASASAVCMMGVCGEQAHAQLGQTDGNATYRNRIINAAYRLTPLQLEENANYEMR